MRNQQTGKYLIAEYASSSWVERPSHPGAWDIVPKPSVSPLGPSQEDAHEALRWLEQRLELARIARLAKKKKK
jgi:hypothetical protein